MSQMLSAPLPWLSILVALPALGAVLLLAIPSLRRAGRAFALILSLCELVVAIVAAVAFDWSHSSTYQLSEAYSWIPQIGLSWALAVNALGLVMVLLAVALVPLVVVAGWNEDEDPARTGAYLGWVLFLESFMVLIFAASDVLLFYLAFEGMLVPLFVMIGRYGVGEKKARQRAAMQFLLFSLAGGLVMLGGLVAIWALAARRGDTLFMIDTLSSGTVGLPVGIQIGLFLTFFIAFAIKAPMVPLHTWLPDTAEHARPGTSVLLVGILDKVGTFGMITLCLRLFPLGAASLQWWICGFAVLSILWGGLAAIGQNDIMRLVSYTSVSHFGFMVLGIFIGSQIALTGAMVYMVAHGVSIAAMFLLSGWLSRRGGTQDMRQYGGMQRVSPVLAGLWLFSGLASVALPGLSGFVPEYLVLMGTWKVSTLLALFAVLGVVLAALYMLMPYQRVFTGPPREDKKHIADLNGREKTVMTPLVIAMLVLGIWAAPLVSALAPIADEGSHLLTAATATLSEGSAQ